MNRKSVVVLAVSVVALVSQQSSAQQCSQHTFIGDSPSHGDPGWHTEAQGLAHDRDHWYVTQNNNVGIVNTGDPTNAFLWRIHVTTDLAADVTCGEAGVSCAKPLAELGLDPRYNHYGDPDFYQYGRKGYVLVPLEGLGGVPNGLLVFRADATLEFLTLTPFPGQASSPWVAVDRDGILYSSEFNTEAVINRFRLDWASFSENEHTSPVLEQLEPLLLQDETGAGLDLHKAQGGEFSDDGRRLYFVNGDGNNEAEPDEGIHVFRVLTATGDQCGPGSGSCIVARQIERSYNSDDPGFAFEFHPGANIGASFQEPEGLTFWDLDADGRAPGTRGQLHVVLLDNDGDDDEVYVKHYSFVDSDTEPPVLTCPAPITVECVSPAGVPAGSPQLVPFFAAVSATDACTSSPLITHNAPGAFPLGTTPVTFTATDESGNASSCQAPVTVVDTTPPTISLWLSRDTLWPPNHKLVPVTAQVTVADTCGQAAFELVSISSNEPDDGVGDGHTDDDIQGTAFGTADTSFLLRAERAGSSTDGRVYTVVYRVRDGSGNANTATATVRVPHSK